MAEQELLPTEDNPKGWMAALRRFRVCLYFEAATLYIQRWPNFRVTIRCSKMRPQKKNVLVWLEWSGALSSLTRHQKMVSKFLLPRCIFQCLSDWASNVCLQDPSLFLDEEFYSTRDYTVTFFQRRFKEWLPQVNIGDILVLHDIKARYPSFTHNLSPDL
jgi:hypothetical protein